MIPQYPAGMSAQQKVQQTAQQPAPTPISAPSGAPTELAPQQPSVAPTAPQIGEAMQMGAQASTSPVEPVTAPQGAPQALAGEAQAQVTGQDTIGGQSTTEPGPGGAPSMEQVNQTINELIQKQMGNLDEQYKLRSDAITQGGIAQMRQAAGLAGLAGQSFGGSFADAQRQVFMGTQGLQNQAYSEYLGQQNQLYGRQSDYAFQQGMQQQSQQFQEAFRQGEWNRQDEQALGDLEANYAEFNDQPAGYDAQGNKMAWEDISDPQVQAIIEGKAAQAGLSPEEYWAIQEDVAQGYEGGPSNTMESSKFRTAVSERGGDPNDPNSKVMYGGEWISQEEFAKRVEQEGWGGASGEGGVKERGKELMLTDAQYNAMSAEDKANWVQVTVDGKKVWRRK